MATVTTAVSATDFSIPLIDFTPFRSDNNKAPVDTALRASTAREILRGFQNAGFIYLRNHGIPADALAQTFSASAAFFARPQAQKNALCWTTPRANRGYSQPGREKTTDATDAQEIARLRELEGADLKESMEIGREGEPGQPNQWPVDGPGDKEGEAEKFKAQMIHFHGLVKELHVQIMRAIAVGLGIEEGWFDGYTRNGDNTLRLLHYPPVAAEVFRKNERTVRAGAHTDYGSITCLFQDTAGGLQVLSPSGTYVDATPIADTIVVNAGDLLARWSNDTIKSTKHRVVEPPRVPDDAVRAADGRQVYPARYSIAYFCNPDFDRFIEAIPGTWDDAAGRPRRYESVNSGDYLVQRLSATY